MSKQQTAMQDLRSSLAALNHEVNNPAYELINTIIKGIDTVYLEMERKQIATAFEVGFSDGYSDALYNGFYFEDGKEYYEKTYGTDTN